ncbi:MAG: pseudouridine synthase [Neisseriaceae bacterium]
MAVKPGNKSFSRGKPESVVAKKMVLRKPNKLIQAKASRLRKKRVDKGQLASQRLQKILAASGLGSRREMEVLIHNGQVKINGKQAQLGDRVNPSDEVKVKGKVVVLHFPDRLPRIVLYHKREGEIVSRSDPQGRTSVFDRVPMIQKSQQWICIGRLDINTTGLLVFTTSGDLVNRFSHPRYRIDREYRVRVNGQLTEEQLTAILTDGIELEDGLAKVVQINALTQPGEMSKNFWYQLVLQEGKNREVRRLFQYFGLTVSKLVRIRFGPIAIPPRLRLGQYYELNELEVEYVLKEMGMGNYLKNN